MEHVHVPRGAEAFNFVTHGVGALLAVAGLVILVVLAEGPLAVTSFAVYGATLVALFAASTTHHLVQTAHGQERSGWLRRIDHISIFLFIAGTYTPVCLVGLGGAWGWSLFGVVWGLAVAGVALKLFAPFTPRWLTSLVYVLMGWVVLVGIVPVVERFAGDGLVWLVAGGVVYTLGAVGYALKKPDLWPRYVGFHGVWHLMVLAGAGLHFAFLVAHVV